MKNWSAGLLGLQHFLILLLLSFGTSAQVHAAISEFFPVQPVVGLDFPYDRLETPYGPPLGAQSGIGIFIRDGFAGNGAFDTPGLDSAIPMYFNVGGINTPITRVEVIIGLWHPHIHDLTADLISPDGTSVRLFSGLSTQNAPIYINGGFYWGAIGGGYPGTVTLQSDPEEDDELKFINDPTLLNTDPASIQYLNTIPAGTYLSQGNLADFNGKFGADEANGLWRIRVVDSNRNNFTTNPDGTVTTYDWEQYIYYVQLIITQEGGYKVWTGAVNNNWNNAGNWDATYGMPTNAEINSILFPADAVNFAPVNNIAGAGGQMRIAEISTNGPTPYTVDLGPNITFYKRTHFTNYDGNHTVTINATAGSQAGRLKLEAVTGQLTLNGAINGAIGLKKFGPGTVVLNGASGYTGNTIVQEGILQVNNATALGNNGATQYTVIRNTGQISVGPANFTIAEPLWLENTGKTHQALHISGTQLWSGLIKFILVSGYDFASSVQIDVGSRLIVRNFDTTAPDLYHWLITGGGTVELAQLLPIPTTTGLLPTGTMLQVNGSTFQFNIDQTNNIGNIILENGTITGAGALTPISLGTFATSGGLVASSGTSIIANNMTISGTDTGVNVTGGTLTMNGVIAGSVVKRGGGTLELNGVMATLPVSVEVGVLGGSGSLGAVSVARQGAINPTVTLNVTNATFANQSAFIVDAQTDELVASGTVDLGGALGVGGAVLQVYDGVTPAKTIISGTNINTFDGMPVGTPGITYTPGTSVILNAAGGLNTDTGLTVWFDPSSYVVNEAAGTVTVTAKWSGGPGTAFLRNYGGSALRGRDLNFSLSDAGAVGSDPLFRNYTIPILQNYIQSGDSSTTLALVPQRGARLASAPPAGGPVASLLILDDDKVDAQPCGFGTGLTVFFLLGFGFLWQLRLRRR